MERQAVNTWAATEQREKDSPVPAARRGDRAAFERTYERDWPQHAK